MSWVDSIALCIYNFIILIFFLGYVYQILPLYANRTQLSFLQLDPTSVSKSLQVHKRKFCICDRNRNYRFSIFFLEKKKIRILVPKTVSWFPFVLVSSNAHAWPRCSATQVPVFRRLVLGCWHWFRSQSLAGEVDDFLSALCFLPAGAMGLTGLLLLAFRSGLLKLCAK